MNIYTRRRLRERHTVTDSGIVIYTRTALGVTRRLLFNRIDSLHEKEK